MNEKLSKQKKCDLFTSVNYVNRSLSLLNRINCHFSIKLLSSLSAIIRQVVCGTAVYGSHKGLRQQRKNILHFFLNPVINEALRRVNNGYSFYDKIKPILVTDS